MIPFLLVLPLAILLYNPTNALSPTSVQRFYGLVGPALDLMSIVEDKPRNRALELADLSDSNKDCQSLLEIGPGTGRTAQQILQQSNIPQYTALELTPRMAQLATDKVGSLPGVTILQGDCLEADPVWNQQPYDRIVAFYVLDIFTKEQIEVFLQKCQHALSPNGKLVLVSITNPNEEASFLAKTVMGTWEFVSNLSPVLLGGCRPIQLTTHLSKDVWKIEHCEQMSVLGYTSEIVIASSASRAVGE